MDPYLEEPAVWPDFHARFVSDLCAAMQPLLRPNYVAVTERRLYVYESDRGVRPDITIVENERRAPRRHDRLGGAALEVDEPTVFTLDREEVRESYVTIVEPKSRRIITAIELLSPDNKRPGAGRDSYLKKREELWTCGANLVEIDLLRAGSPTVRVSVDHLESLRPWHYVVAVSRLLPARQEVYTFILDHRLPRIAVPLLDGDRDVPLDLQAVFTQCWIDGPYPELLDYDGPPPGKLTATEKRWCTAQLRSKSKR